MTGSVDRIDRDIAALEQGVLTIAQEFHATYSQYLADLGQTVRQQLILASYHLCTKGYPERFLQLSFNQRQQLQQALVQLGRQAQAQLLLPLQPSEEELDGVPSDASPPDSPPENDEEVNAISEESTTAPTEADIPENELEEELLLSEAALEEDEEEEEEQPTTLSLDQPMSPETLAQWQKNLERSIAGVLQTISHAANRLLQQAEILPSKLPEPVLEVAAKAGMVAESPSNTPNLLNLLVETEEQEESKITHIIAIRLRLSEIEFGDSTLTSWRSKLRNLSSRLNQLGREYQKKQRERSIAEAEAAWRSSWYEE